jgi:hypothetical protein
MLITIYLCDFIAMEICVTRFNEATFKENRLWIKKNNGSLGCIYGLPVKISDTLDPDSQLLVLEMNNSKNIIEGIGIIKNNLARENRKYYKIYADNNYNRFIYKSNYRIDRKNFTSYESEIITFLEDYLFKSAYHCKRGQGIQKIPKCVAKNDEFDFVRFLITMYKNRFVTIKNIKIVR